VAVGRRVGRSVPPAAGVDGGLVGADGVGVGRGGEGEEGWMRLDGTS
jgi:hypothetical protein